MPSQGNLFSRLMGEKRTGKAEPAAKAKAKTVTGAKSDYTAADIEVLEGLEPVRRRPGMYIGGTDSKAYHHLFAEVIDNSMDEAVAGFASQIHVELNADGSLTVEDDGRGIPIDPHPKYKDKSALEVILTTLHSGGKFDSDVYATSGGLHGVGVSVVNALSELLVIDVSRNKKLYRQVYRRGLADSKLEIVGKSTVKNGTKMTFLPDEEIFGERIKFDPKRLFRMARSKAYLFGGVEIIWKCAPELIKEGDTTPTEAVFHFPGGLRDFLTERLEGKTQVTKTLFAGKLEKEGGHGSVEWAIGWVASHDGLMNSYCNTVPTPDGGTHENGLRAALTKGLRSYGEITKNKKASQITADDVLGTSATMLAVFIREPEFQGQTKEKLSSVVAAKIVESALRDAFDHWLTANPPEANKLLEWVIDRSEERLKRKRDKDVSRKTATARLRLPGKLTDCSQKLAKGTELFIVEGDSAGGSAKQARNRKNQAILPLRGKILNVANASASKLSQNQLLSDLTLALGSGTGKHYNDADLRYEKIIIMTDADVDGAHIASLLITFFYRQMPELIDNDHLYLALPPLYSIKYKDKKKGSVTLYAMDEADRDEILESPEVKGKKVEIGRFKGLGEMMAKQLKDTTMDPTTRTLLRVEVEEEEREATNLSVQNLMGNKPETRFIFISENAEFAENLDI